MIRTEVRAFFLSSCLFALINLISGCSNKAPGDPSSASVAATPPSAPVITPAEAYLLPGQTIQFSANFNGVSLANPIWSVNQISGGSSTAGTISSAGLYTAPSGSAPGSVQITVTDPAHNTSSAPATVALYQPGHIPAGTVSATNNPLVALYTIAIPQGTSVQIQFGTTTNYGLTTWAQPAPVGGGVVGIYVAGMRASSTYHMQAAIQLPDGSQVTDADRTFTTGAVPASLLPSITTQLAGAGTPSPGVELFSYIQGATQNLICALATDLGGNVVWYYPLPEGAYPFPIKLLPNGHMMLATGGAVNDVREIDLAGNLISQISSADITAALASNPSFQNTTWGGLNHDFLTLPNGHVILLASLWETVNNVPGVADGTAVEGNALIEWAPQQNALVWAWSTFDHLDLTYAPYGISDWTHGNAVIYSPDDGNLIFSMRNQNWVVKINYANGGGDGSILWRFGPGGDFTMPNQEAPIEWNYGQHYPTITSPNSSGIFDLMVFNNGNNRLMDASNDVCGSSGVAACYSSVPVYEVNEYTKTASVLWEDYLSPAFSGCCGDAQLLPNGNVEFDIALAASPSISTIEEVTQTSPPQLIWQMNVQGSPDFFNLVYRGFRIPSLYPGVEWPQTAIETANAVPAVQPRR